MRGLSVQECLLALDFPYTLAHDDIGSIGYVEPGILLKLLWEAIDWLAGTDTDPALSVLVTPVSTSPVTLNPSPPTSTNLLGTGKGLLPSGLSTAAPSSNTVGTVARSDNAAAPTEIWNIRAAGGAPTLLRRIDPSSRVSFLEWMRRWLLCQWQRLLTRSLVRWLTHQYGNWSGAQLRSSQFHWHRRLGVAVLRQAFRATWWGWKGGGQRFSFGK